MIGTQSQTNLRRYSYWKEKITSIFICFIVIGILGIAIKYLGYYGLWQPANFNNSYFDIFIVIELVTFLMIFFIAFIFFGTYSTITINERQVALYGPSFIKFTFGEVSFFEVFPPKPEGGNNSNPVNHIISIHLKSGKRIRLRTPPTLFFDSCRTAMEKDLLDTIKAPVRIYESNKSD